MAGVISQCPLKSHPSEPILNSVSERLTLAVGCCQYGRTKVSVERDGIYRQEHSDQDNQFENFAHEGFRPNDPSN